MLLLPDADFIAVKAVADTSVLSFALRFPLLLTDLFIIFQNVSWEGSSGGIEK
jgi:hypothetical protein